MQWKSESRPLAAKNPQKVIPLATCRFEIGDEDENCFRIIDIKNSQTIVFAVDSEETLLAWWKIFLGDDFDQDHFDQLRGNYVEKRPKRFPRQHYSREDDDEFVDDKENEDDFENDEHLDEEYDDQEPEKEDAPSFNDELIEDDAEEASDRRFTSQRVPFSTASSSSGPSWPSATKTAARADDRSTQWKNQYIDTALLKFRDNILGSKWSFKKWVHIDRQRVLQFSDPVRQKTSMPKYVYNLKYCVLEDCSTATYSAFKLVDKSSFIEGLYGCEVMEDFDTVFKFIDESIKYLNREVESYSEEFQEIIEVSNSGPQKMKTIDEAVDDEVASIASDFQPLNEDIIIDYFTQFDVEHVAVSLVNCCHLTNNIFNLSTGKVKHSTTETERITY